MINFLKTCKYFITYLVISFLIILFNHHSINLHSQVVFVQLENGVYEFLERLSLKGIINLDDEIKPLSRIYIAAKLIEIQSSFIRNNNLINHLEIEELKFYKEEFDYEINQILKISYSELEKDLIAQLRSDKERWFLFSYSDSLFNLKTFTNCRLWIINDR